eukprot:gene14792-20842_t
MARSSMLNDFRKGRVRAMVCSDVLARGMDIQDCDAVFHLEMPSSAGHYAHRAGRTGRMGAQGMVISIVAREEVFVVDKMARALGVPILEAHVYRGELALGPPPVFDMKYDDEDEKAKEKKKSKAGSSKEGDQPSSSTAESTDATATSSSTRPASSKARKSKLKAKGKPSRIAADGSDSDDDDDGDVDQDVVGRAFKSARSNGTKAAIPDTFSADVAESLKKELAELEAEKKAPRPLRLRRGGRKA